MGEANRRRAAATANPIANNNDIDIDKFARAVQAVQFVSPLGGGSCWSINMLAQKALASMGVKAELVFGSALFRAGPCGHRDVVAHCHSENDGRLVEGGRFFGHVYLRAMVNGADMLLDFSAGEWRSVYDNVAGSVADDGLGLVVWQAEPPAYYAGPWASMTRTWRPKGSPPIGSCWFGPWHGPLPSRETFEDVDRKTSFVVRNVVSIYRGETTPREASMMIYG